MSESQNLILATTWPLGIRVVMTNGEIVKVVGYSSLETFPPKNVIITIEHANGTNEQFSEHALLKALGAVVPIGEAEMDHDPRWSHADVADLNAERRALHYGDESPPSIEDLRYEAAERRFARETDMLAARPGSWADDDVED